jgi:calcineurin-like phosphoesterase family protein
MFTFGDKQYDNVWFTSDEHYGSDRHITLSKRLEFDETFEKIRRMKELESDCPGKIKLSSVYGEFGKTPVEKMTDELVKKHNIRVGDNDLVFHLGDFGEYDVAKYLNGYHVLIMGNYDYDYMEKYYNGDFMKFREDIISKYNFIEVYIDFNIDACDFDNDGVLSQMLSDEVSYIHLTHKPMDCIWFLNKDYGLETDTENDGKYIMNLFGHIHEKAKVKRFGLNVGIDCNHYYPISSVEVVFYLKAILHHYDENVFM